VSDDAGKNYYTDSALDAPQENHQENHIGSDYLYHCSYLFFPNPVYVPLRIQDRATGSKTGASISTYIANV
jgi:hypothetical protein